MRAPDAQAGKSQAAILVGSDTAQIDRSRPSLSARTAYGKDFPMKIKNLVIGSLVLSVLVVAVTAYAQVKRPFHNGSVWNIAFIRMKPGMETAYLNYLAGPWKANQE